jgi:ethanolamine utilization protein EutA
MKTIRLLGLDFGSTTSSLLASSARVLVNSVTGRTELGEPTILYCSERAFTPLRDNQIDEGALTRLLDRWLGEAKVDCSSLGAGGVIITGLAAQKHNVAAIKALVRERIGGALFATADDPHLESWLAFMGSCLPLSRANPETYFLNLDIGGGTTNLALGQGGTVLRTGCLVIGARHVQVVPGTYRIQALSSHARKLLHSLAIDKKPGDDLEPAHVQAIVDFYVTLLESTVGGVEPTHHAEMARELVQAPFVAPGGIAPIITLSGGVGELVYRRLQGTPLPGTAAFGDLGIELAQRLLQSPVLGRNLRTHIPVNFGHATLYGICLFGTELSGSTLYLSDPSMLPLTDMPILARLDANTSREEMERAVDMAGRGKAGGCIEIGLETPNTAAVKKVGLGLAAVLREQRLPAERALVLFVSANVGKSLGSYATDWGRLPVKLAAIDEISIRSARFASLGALRNNVVPVSLYGLQ